MDRPNLAIVQLGSLIQRLVPVGPVSSAVGPRRTRNRRAHDHGTENMDHRRVFDRRTSVQQSEILAFAIDVIRTTRRRLDRKSVRILN